MPAHEEAPSPPRSVSLIQFLCAPLSGTLSCPLQTLPRQKKDERPLHRPGTHPGSQSLRAWLQLPAPGPWLASVLRPGGPAAGPGRRTGPLPLSARSRCLGNRAPPSRDPPVGPAADHVTWRAGWGHTSPPRSRGSSPQQSAVIPVGPRWVGQSVGERPLLAE